MSPQFKVMNTLNYNSQYISYIDVIELTYGGQKALFLPLKGFLIHAFTLHIASIRKSTRPGCDVRILLVFSFFLEMTFQH